MPITVPSVKRFEIENGYSDRDISGLTMKPSGLVTDDIRDIMNWILYGVLLMVVCGFGIATNIINIICFVRQGLKDPVNVSVLGLAISDLCSLVTSVSIGFCNGPTFRLLDSPVEILDIGYIVIVPPHFLFTGLTSWITALITLERCLCITKPVKVKSLITPKRVTIILLCIAILFTCSTSLMHRVGKLSWVFNPERNKTILRLVYSENGQIVEQVYFPLNAALIPFSAYLTIIVCTFTLVVNLRHKARWRMASTTSVSGNVTSKRDQQVARMVIAISTLFIACYTPICLLAIFLTTVPGLAMDGPNQNLLYIFGGVSLVLQSGNSSANIFIYYHMSSRYRAIFRTLCRCREVT